MSSAAQNLAEAQRVREEGERLVREGREMNRTDAAMLLRDELDCQPDAADALIKEADAYRTSPEIAAVPGVRPALVLVADTPGAAGWPASGRYRLIIA